MSTGLIIAIIVVVVIILIALLFVSPRLRVKRHERELHQRRQRVAKEHHQQAEVRTGRAEAAEHQARIAEHEAQRERAKAQLHESRAEVHEQGLADHELVENHERDRFAGTSAVREPGSGRGVEQGADRDGSESLDSERVDPVPGSDRGIRQENA